MLTGTLTNLATVKSWLSLKTDDADHDIFLLRLIKGASEFTLNYMNRNSFGRTEYNNQLLDGYGNPFIVLREWPVISITSLGIGSRAVNAASGSPPNNGYWLDDVIQNAPQKLTYLGGGFPRGRSTIMISYVAGYFVADELHTIPETPAPLPDPPPGPQFYSVATYQFWYAIYSVFTVEIVPVELIYTKEAAPADGEYTVDKDTGLYVFNVAQQGMDVLISYSYVPADIVQAVTEIVGERFKAKDRIGYNSKSLGGQETVSFNNQSLSSFTRELLNPYRRVF